MSKTQVFLSVFWISVEFRQILQHMDSNFLISQIAEKLGFSGVYAFSKAFKAYYRMPPSDLLKKA